jgi:hypothetical protein
VLLPISRKATEADWHSTPAWPRVGFAYNTINAPFDAASGRPGAIFAGAKIEGDELVSGASTGGFSFAQPFLLGANEPAFTFLSFRTTDTTGPLISIRDTAGTAFDLFNIYIGYNGATTYANGSVCAIVRDSSGVSSGTVFCDLGNSSVLVNDGRQHTALLMRNSAGTVTLWVDGLLVATGGTAISGALSGSTAGGCAVGIDVGWVNAAYATSAQRYLEGRFRHAFGIKGRELNAKEIKSFHDDPSQIYESGRGILVVGSATAHNLAAANASQANSAATAAITQAHAIVATATTQANAASASAVTQDHALAAGAASQANTSSSPAITQDHSLAGAASTQGNAASTGAVTQGAQFIADVCTQANVAGTGAITQAHELAAVNGTQANTSSSAAVTQDHALAVAGSAQANTAGTGAITQGTVHDLTAANSTQANTGAAGALTQAHVLVCAPSIQDNIAAASAIVQAHVLIAASGAQANAGSTGAIEQISGVPPVDGPAGSGPRLRAAHGRRQSTRNTSRPRQLR